MADKIKDGGPAFPVLEAITQSGNARSSGGMSLRDWFAGQAMSGALAGEPGSHLVAERLAKDSYAFADAMLKARKGEL